MNLHLLPTLKSMRHSALGFTLIFLQVILSLAVVVNAFSGSRWLAKEIAAENGIDIANLLAIEVYGYNNSFVVGTDALADLDFLRNHSSVVDAIQTNAVPLSNSGWYTSLRTSADLDAPTLNAAQYMVDEHVVNTLDLEIVTGRNFLPEEVVWRDGPNASQPAAALVTESLAQKLFPEHSLEEVLGQLIYHDGDNAAPVVGILRMMPQPNARTASLHDSILFAQDLAWVRYRYLVRTEPGYLDMLIPELEKELIELNPNRLVASIKSLESIHRQSTNGNYVVVWIFSITTFLLTATTMLSIVGVGNFNIKRRINQISIRRVLGATKQDILLYFLIEIAILLVVGMSLGLLVGIGFNILLVTAVNFPKLEWFDWLLPCIVFLILGLLSVALTAMQATRVSPVPR